MACWRMNRAEEECWRSSKGPPRSPVDEGAAWATTLGSFATDPTSYSSQPLRRGPRAGGVGGEDLAIEDQRRLDVVLVDEVRCWASLLGLGLERQRDAARGCLSRQPVRRQVHHEPAGTATSATRRPQPPAGAPALRGPRLGSWSACRPSVDPGRAAACLAAASSSASSVVTSAKPAGRVARAAEVLVARSPAACSASASVSDRRRNSASSSRCHARQYRLLHRASVTAAPRADGPGPGSFAREHAEYHQRAGAGQRPAGSRQ